MARRLESGGKKVLMVITRVAAVCALLFVTIGLFVVMTRQAETGPSNATPTIAQVRVFQARQVPIARQWRGFGTAKASQSTNIPARVTAVVTERPAASEPGKPIAQGQMLLRLDASDFQSRLQTTENLIAEINAQLQLLDVEKQMLADRIDIENRDVQLAKEELARARKLFERKSANQSDLDIRERAVLAAERSMLAIEQSLAVIPARRAQLQSARQVQEAQRDLARLNVQRATIRSPLDGVIQQVLVEEGESVMAGQVLVRVVDPSRIEVPVSLPPAARASVATGDAVTLFSSSDGLSWSATISRIEPEDDPDTRTMTAYVELPQQTADGDGQGALVPGRFVQAVVTSSQIQSRWVAPRRAVRDGRLQVVEQGRLQSRPVEVDFAYEGTFPQFGLADTQWVVLENTPTPMVKGQLVLVSASAKKLDGQRLEPILITTAQARPDAPQPASEDGSP